jgi:tetratricopeptide (TPR) repeat protein
MRRLRWSGLAAVLTALALAGNAAAQPAPGPRPWAAGVSQADQKAAIDLFNEGNGLLRDAIFPKAAEKYREALGHWDHPAIYYNLALALVNLDQPIEMYRALEKAMQYGAAPIDQDKFDRAKSLKITVEKTLANVEYTVDVDGAKMVFNGKEVFTGPGTWKQLIPAGEHSVTVRADGYVTSQVTSKILGGETDKRTFVLFTADQLLRTKRLMPAWVPYTVGGLGAAIIGGGVLLHQSAKSKFDEYDAGIKDCAAVDPTGGCTNPPAGLPEKQTSANTTQTIAIGAYALGGVAFAAGVTLFVLNRPQTYRVDPKEVAESEGVSVFPILSPGLTGIAATGRF